MDKTGQEMGGLAQSSIAALQQNRFAPSSSFTARPPSQALHHPPSFPKLSSHPPPSSGQRDGGRRKTKTTRVGLTRRVCGFAVEW